MKIVFAGTPVFSRMSLEALLKTQHEIVAVYTQPDKTAGRGQHFHMSPVKELALSHQLQVEQPATLRTQEAAEKLAQFQPDLMIVAAYGMLLPENILTIPRYGCVNIHASLLPRWRGASPIQHAILAGDAQTGITLMQMDKGLDTGAMLAKSSCAISPQDNAQSLHDKLAILGAQCLLEHLDSLSDKKRETQDSEQATYAHKITKEQGHINWHLSAIEIERQIRAYNPWPVSFSSMDDLRVRIWQAEVVPLDTSQPGTIIAHRSEGVVVSTNQDGLLITKAQLPGKKAIPFHEILNGHSAQFAIGKQFK